MDTNVIPFQEASLDIWDKKYRLRAKDGVAVDKDIDGTYRRVARALAAVERFDQLKHEEEFYWALQNGAIPAGRITSNAGAGEHKPNTSLINCTVSDTIQDSMHGILTGVLEAGTTLAAGCGIGYEFSTLRPKGAYVGGVGASTSGALSFMDIYDTMCGTVASAGGRRGAQMGTLDVCHPDVKDFIKAKRQDGRLRQFNLSLLISDDFMRAVEGNAEWELYFPLNKRESWLGPTVWKPWPSREAYMTTSADDSLVLCKVYETLPAARLWDMVMRATYDYAEPGFILIDRVNNENNLWWCENIRATNPCGEQPLPPYGACLLGSINLTKFVVDPFTERAFFDYEKFVKVAQIFTRMLDNVVELGNLPLQEQREEIFSKRRHGMGFLGLGSALTMMCIKYGSEKAVDITGKIAEAMAVANWTMAAKLSKEKGEAPVLSAGYDWDGSYQTGRELLMQSNYMKRLFRSHPYLEQLIGKHGARFSHATSVAPTGTISLSLANNASNGIEPSFAHHYTRNVIREGRNAKEAVDVYSYEFLAYKTLIDPNATVNSLPDYFVKADDITPRQHVDMQAAAQPWIDSSISKTANVPTDMPFSEFEDIYMHAWKSGLKGCTTFRFNPEAFQGVLARKEDLANTTYVFTTGDGKEHSFKGSDEVEYEGQTHTAANLFDALKEGYYGRL